MRSVFIVAEAGVNHNGRLDLALKLVDAAKEAGADSVKFQTFKAERLVTPQAPKAKYQIKNIGSDESQFEMLKKLELSVSDQKQIHSYCKERSILFLSTPFDEESADMLDSMEMTIFKIPSGEITNFPYLQKVGSLKRRIILSSGMSDLGEVEAALDILMEAGTSRKDITVLHCNTEYPTPYEDVNLSAMITLKNALKVDVGYSDHTLGIEISVAAAALGATVIEKHFTLDRTMEGPDHKASLEPQELKAMVKAIRNVEIALGNGIKKPSRSEMKNLDIARKSIVAAQSISKGEILTEENITVKRPGSGISPMEWNQVLGRKAVKDFLEDELIEL